MITEKDIVKVAIEWTSNDKPKEYVSLVECSKIADDDKYLIDSAICAGLNPEVPFDYESAFNFLKIKLEERQKILRGAK